MAGGRTTLGGNSGIDSVEILDLSTNTWRLGSNPMPEALYGGSSIAYEGTFLAVGGSLSNPHGQSDKIYKYVPDTETWETLAPTLDQGRGFAVAMLVPESYCP